MKDIKKWKLKWKTLFGIGIFGAISGLVWLSIYLGIIFPTIYD